MASALGRRRLLGKYRIRRKIADGGSATVYRALDTVEGVDVALKVPKAEVMTPKLMRWVRHEIRLQAGLDHPSVLQLKNADMVEDRLVMAYRLGVESLADRMRRRMSVETFLELADQMLDAVAHAHAHGVVHCDLKPDNFILFPGNSIRLTDFSISKFARRTIAASGSGTIGYVAPEQAMGKTSFRADVFSLGLILYQMLTAHLPEWPFHWPPPGHDRLRRKVPVEFGKMLRRALEITPSKRFADAGEMLNAFRRLVPRVRRHAARDRRRPTSGHIARDWREVRQRQFRREFGASFSLKHECAKCHGPVDEAMSGCPWCGVALSFKRRQSEYPATCARCHRGRKLDWRFCTWCFGGKFAEIDARSYSDRRYKGRCAAASCRGPLMPFSRYCPWCRRKVAKPARVSGTKDKCGRCGWSVLTRYWEHCPWCRGRLARS